MDQILKSTVLTKHGNWEFTKRRLGKQTLVVLGTGEMAENFDKNVKCPDTKIGWKRIIKTTECAKLSVLFFFFF